MSDRELLHRYAQETSQEAFAEFVRRHVNLVYGTALRQLCGDAALAEEVTQRVFTLCAQKAAAVARVAHLSSWLYTTTRFNVSHTLRAERRRQARETKAQMMHAILNAADSSEPLTVPAEMLDDALENLDEADREAVLLRYFEGASYAAIGASMRLGEDAARMRVTRALEKVRELFARRGITSSAAAIGAALSSQAVAAPVTLAASITHAALVGGAIGGAKLGALAFMTTTKAGVLAAGAVAVLALGYSGFERHNATARGHETVQVSAERDRLREELAQAQQNATKLERRLGEAEQRLAELQRKPPTPIVKQLNPPAPSGASNDVTARKAKMAQLRPLLEAGHPIKAAVIFTVNDQPVSQPVEFVMGRETRVETPNGTYVVTPSLNGDGSVKYALGIVRKNTDVRAEEVMRLPSVTQTPWDSFLLRSGENIVAIDPDPIAP